MSLDDHLSVMVNMFTDIIAWIVFVFVSLLNVFWVFNVVGAARRYGKDMWLFYELRTKMICLHLMCWFLAGRHLFG